MSRFSVRIWCWKAASSATSLRLAAASFSTLRRRWRWVVGEILDLLDAHAQALAALAELGDAREALVELGLLRGALGGQALELALRSEEVPVDLLEGKKGLQNRLHEPEEFTRGRPQGKRVLELAARRARKRRVSPR
jgi:hypothetical protein